MNAAHSSARLTGNRTSTFSRFYFSDFVYRDLMRQLSALTGSPPILGGLTLSGTKTERTKTYLLRKMEFIPICF